MNKIVRNFATTVLLVTAVAVARPSGSNPQQQADVSSHPWIGNAAPGFSLKKIGGGQLKLKDLNGKYVVIHFGASW